MGSTDLAFVRDSQAQPVVLFSEAAAGQPAQLSAHDLQRALAHARAARLRPGLCRPFGAIDRIKLKVTKDSGDCAVVRFDYQEHARRAHEAGLSFAGRPLITRLGASDSTVVVRHLDPWITDDLLEGVVCVGCM